MNVVEKRQPRLREMGLFVRERRRALGLTQTELAERVGYVQERISVLERGKYGMPSLPALALLAEALEVPLAEMLQRAGYQVGDDDGASGQHAGVNELADRFIYLVQQNSRLTAGVSDLQRRLEDACATMSEVDSLRERLRLNREQMQSAMAALYR